jgi:hypothetical protein
MAATLNFRFVANAAGLQKGIAGAKGDLTGFQKTTEGVSKKIGMALGAISFVAVVKGLTDAAKAASEDAIAQNKLALQIQTSTNATDAQIKANEAFILAMSKEAGVADDVLRPALANAVRGTGDLTTAQNLLKVGLDGAAATGKPLETIMKALTQAQNGNTTSLYKLAPQLKATKGGVDDFAKSVAGAAGTAASPFAKFKVALDEAKETIGAAFLPVIEKLIVVLGPLIEKIAPVLARVIEKLAPIFVTLVEALLPLVEMLLPPLVELLEALMPVILPLVKMLTQLLVPIIKIVVQQFKFWLGVFTPILLAVGKFVIGIKDAFGGIVNAIKTPINSVIGALESFFNFAIGGVNKLVDGINFLLAGVNAVTGMKLQVGKIPKLKIPRLADGGIVMPSPGGSIVNVAEAGQAEAIIPLSKLGNLGGGNTYNININRATLTGEEIVQAIRRYEVSRGRSVVI